MATANFQALDDACPSCGFAFITDGLQNFPDAPSRLLNSNDELALEEEATALRSAVSEATAKLDEVDVELERLQRGMDRLKQQRNSLIAVRSQYQKALSPIRRIPAEILSAIFLLVEDEEWPAPGAIGLLNEMHAPFVLRRTCKRWQAITDSHPALWSRISIDGAWANYWKPARLDFIHRYLQRSGNHPLTIHFTTSPNAYSPSHPVLELLMEHSARWQDVFLCISGKLWLTLSKVAHHLPSLVRLRLRSYLQCKSLPALHVFETAPLLQEVTLCSDMLPMAMAWPQSTSFHGRKLCIDDLLDNMAGAPKLCCCELEPRWAKRSDLSPAELQASALHSEGLHALHLRADTDGPTDADLRYLFLRLEVPQLQHLAVDGKRFGSIFDPLAAFLLRSSAASHLSSLRLREIQHMTEEELIQLLELVPNLTHLSLDAATSGCSLITGAVMQRLTLNKNWNLVPKLETLSLRGAYAPEEGEDFKGMVGSRMPSTTRASGRVNEVPRHVGGMGCMALVEVTEAQSSYSRVWEDLRPFCLEGLRLLVTQNAS